MPKFKITTSTGMQLYFEAEDEINARIQFIGVALDDYLDRGQNLDYGEIIEIIELLDDHSTIKIKSIVCTNTGKWFDIEECKVVFNVDFDPLTKEPIIKDESRAAHLEQICIMALERSIQLLKE